MMSAERFELSEERMTEIYRTTVDKAYFVARKALGNDEDAIQDVLQDSYIKAFKAAGDYVETGKLQGWIDTIVIRTATDHLRKKNAIPFSVMEGDDDDSSGWDVEDELHEEFIPEAVADKESTRNTIDALLQALPAEQRLCLMNVVYEGKTAKETAEELGVSENTVKSRLRYAKEKLKDEITALEKKGVVVRSVAPIPLLLWLLRMEADASAYTGASLIGTVTAANAAAAGTAGTSGVASASGTAGAAGVGTVGASGAAAGASGAASAVGTAAAVSTGIGAKVAIGLAIAAAAAVVTIGGVVIKNNIDAQNRASETSLFEQIEEMPEEEPEEPAVADEPEISEEEPAPEPEESAVIMAEPTEEEIKLLTDIGYGTLYGQFLSADIPSSQRLDELDVTKEDIGALLNGFSGFCSNDFPECTRNPGASVYTISKSSIDGAYDIMFSKARSVASDAETVMNEAYFVASYDSATETYSFYEGDWSVYDDSFSFLSSETDENGRLILRYERTFMVDPDEWITDADEAVVIFAPTDSYDGFGNHYVLDEFKIGL